MITIPKKRFLPHLWLVDCKISANYEPKFKMYAALI